MELNENIIYIIKRFDNFEEAVKNKNKNTEILACCFSEYEKAEKYLLERSAKTIKIDDFYNVYKIEFKEKQNIFFRISALAFLE